MDKNHELEMVWVYLKNLNLLAGDNSKQLALGWVVYIFWALPKSQFRELAGKAKW